MNQMLQTVKVGLFFVIGLVLIYTTYSVIGNRQVANGKGYQVNAIFEDVKAVSPGAEIRMAGVRIGKVASASLRDGKGLLRLQIEEGISIPTDSVATIAMSSLLGQNYISVEYGSTSQLLGEEDIINTKESADFNAVLTQIQSLGEKLSSIAGQFSGIGGEDMNNLFTNLNDLVTTNRGQFESTLKNLNEITAKLNSAEGTLGKLINDDSIYNELSLAVTDIRQAAKGAEEGMNQAKNLFSRIEAGEGTIGKLLANDDLVIEIETTVRNLREFSDKLNSGEGTLGKLVTDDSLYLELQGMLNKADKALDSVGDSGPITAAGALSNALF